MNKTYLISGTSSGLGKFLSRSLNAEKFNRAAGANPKSTDVIIHCAFNLSRDVTLENLYSYYQDNIGLTARLLEIPHRKFIYISSVEVYPKDQRTHTEDEKINAESAGDLYRTCKLFSEAMVMQNKNFLILRCAAFLGEDSRKNSALAILHDAKPSVTVKSDSVFNYVTHEQVLRFIERAAEKDLTGIFNVASSENVKIGDIAKKVNKTVKYGDFYYDAGKVANQKICAVLPDFKKSSYEVVWDYLNKEGKTVGR